MGERKGQNHYYPPDFNYKTHGTLNRYHGVHALRERGKRAHEGILTIRFEMPFNIWCLGCQNHVGMSVRYNAEKKKVGMYYTTPIYEFRMKCHLCDNYFTIRTDPKNFDYELVEGLRRQEIRFDPSTIDNLAPVDRTMSLKLASDAMFKAEHVVDDKQKLAGEDQQIQKLEWIQGRLYDDYSTNQALRGAFRHEKKALNEHRARDQEMKSRLSTEIALVPEREEDRRAAKRLALSKHMNVHTERREVLTKEKLMNSPLPSFLANGQQKQQGIGGTSSSALAAASSSTSTSSPAEEAKQALAQKLREQSIVGLMNTTTAVGGNGITGNGRHLARRDLLGIIKVGKNGSNGNGQQKQQAKADEEEDIEVLENPPPPPSKHIGEEKEEDGDGKRKKNQKAAVAVIPGLAVYADDGQTSSSGSDAEEEDEEERKESPN